MNRQAEKTFALELPEAILTQLQDTPQNSRYHAEGSVYNHLLLVMQQFEGHHQQFDLDERDKQALYWAVLTHDLGKPQVTTWRSGRWSSRGHEVAGVPIARDLLLQQPHIDAAQRQRILAIVRYHSAPLQMALHGATLDDYKLLATRVDLRLLGQFAWFDLHGRICVNPDSVYHIIDDFLDKIVPQVEYEFGRFEDLQATFQQASYRHQNALWHAYRQQRPELIQKLLRAETTAHSDRPAFQAVVPVAPLGFDSADYLQQYFPGHEYFRHELPAKEEDNEHIRSNHLRTVRHFVSVFGKEGKNLIVDGPWWQATYREAIIDFIRQQQGTIQVQYVEKPLMPLLDRAANEAEAAAIRDSYQQLSLLHPWEAHRLELVE